MMMGVGSDGDEGIYREIVRLLDQGKGAALATIVSKEGTSPREVGSKLLLREDGSFIGSVGGGALEAQVLEEAKAALAQGKPRLAHLGETGDDPACCGGVLDVYIEPILGPPTLYVIGAGHIGYHLARIGQIAGFRVAVVDDREELTKKERFPAEAEVIATPLPEGLGNLNISPTSFIVILRGHTEDAQILEWALKTPARYVGMIGSKGKIQGIYRALMDKGIGEEELQRVHAPIGMAIGAETPQEIAVAILAEVIKVRRGKD
jgi:xanthine dehydrogenase accessory factor